MAPTVASAFSEFLRSITATAGSLLNAIVAVFAAFLALGQAAITGLFNLANSLVKLGLDLFQGVAGFVMANFLVLTVLAGGYYLYTTRQGNQRRISSTKS